MASRILIAQLGVGCLLLGGCGGSASPPAPARPTSSSAQYLAAANAVCARQLAQLNKLAQPTTPEQAVSYLPHALVIMHRETSGLAALAPPVSERAQVEAGVASTRQLTVLLQRFLHELKGGLVELSTFGRVQTQTGALTAAINAHFRQAGLVACAQ
jgi:hypothetical protein